MIAGYNMNTNCGIRTDINRNGYVCDRVSPKINTNYNLPSKIVILAYKNWQIGSAHTELLTETGCRFRNIDRNLFIVRQVNETSYPSLEVCTNYLNRKK